MLLNKAPCYILISCYVFVQIIQTVDSLKCYKCTDCEEEKHETEECESSRYSCLKLAWKENVLKRCIMTEICSTKDLTSVLPSIFDKFSNFFSNSDEDTRDMNENPVSCCDTDYCNSSNFATNWLGIWGVLALSWIITHLQ